VQFALTQRNSGRASKDAPTLRDNIVHDASTAKYTFRLLFLCRFRCQVSFDYLGLLFRIDLIALLRPRDAEKSMTTRRTVAAPIFEDQIGSKIRQCELRSIAGFIQAEDQAERVKDY